jgi:hypothetical protein
MRRLLVLTALAFWFLFVSVAPALAETSAGLNVTVYSYDSSATPERQPYVLCSDAWTHVDNIDADYDGQNNGVVAGCQTDFVLVHYTGYVTFPDSGVYSFMAPADDGFWLSLDNNTIIDDWFLKGRWGNVYDNVSVEAGHAYFLDAWYYEYGGGANVTLQFKKFDSEFWVTVPSSYFSVDVPVIEPPIVEPPVVEPPVVVPPIVEPPVVVPIPEPTIPVVIPEPPVVLVDPEPPIVPDPPVVVPPVIPDPPIVPVTPPAPDSGDNNPSVIDNPQPPVKPAVEPPVAEPTDNTNTDKPTQTITEIDPSTIDPQTLTDADVVALVAVANATLATADPDSAEYAQALEQLFVAAQADDIVVDQQLASVPVLGNAVVAVADAINYLGNVGADMSPKARATAKKEVIAAVVVTQVATQAAALATQASVSSVAGRRK